MNTKQKAIRELVRPFKQVNDRFLVAGAKLRRRHYDAFQKHQVIRTNGEVPRGKNVAVVLIYQPERLLPSLQDMLRHLVENNISPVVVANHDLNKTDMDTLVKLSHLVVTRPNVGYDFAGYREGIFSVINAGHTPENLFLLNDSIWFPVREDCSLLSDALNAKEDIFGFFYNRYYNNTKLHHLPSFFYRFNARILSNAVFQNYWKRIPFFKDKFDVIRFCELKTTSYFVDRGFSVASKITHDDVANAGLALSPKEKLRVTRYFASSQRTGNSIFGGLAEKTPAASLDKELSQRMLNSRFPYLLMDNHPYVFFGKLKSPILKKNREFRFFTQRKEIRHLGFDQEFTSSIKAELEIWDLDEKLRQHPDDPDFARLQRNWGI